MLDCCSIFSCDCKSHPQCVNENKTGTCCPNDKGVYDPCCSNFQAAVNNPACEKAGVKGNACPDDKGKFHECCHSDAKCSYKNQCPGLAGDCCPTPGGMSLGCCLNKGTVASAVLLPGKAAALPDTAERDAWCHKENWGEGKRCAAAYADHLTRKAARNAGSCEDNQACLDWCHKENWGKGERCAAAYAEHMARKAAISTTSGPTPSGSGLSQLAAVGMPTVGAAFFVVFVVGVAIGARFGRSSTQKDDYHVMG